MASWWDDGKGWLGASVAAPLVLFVATICPTVAFGDSGELIAAAAGLGVAHPPGYPLYTLLAWLALQIPLGQPALSVNLLSALFGALTCGAVAWFIRRATGSAVAAVSAALALGVSSTFWQVSTVAEVYTLHLFFMIAMLSAAQAIGDTSGKARRTALLLAAAALGLGLAHHPTIVLAVPAALVLLLRRPRPPGAPAGSATGLPARLPARTLVVAAALVVVTPLVFDLTLMWRARLDPPSNWGFATDLRSLWIHISATTYRHLDLGWIGLLRGAAWSKLGMLLREELTPMMWPLALIGIVGIPRGGHGAPLPRIRLALALLVGASAIFGLRYATEDVAVFYLPVFVGLAVAGGFGVARLRAHARPAVRATGLVAALLFVLFPALDHFSSRDMRGFTAAVDYARDILDTVPRDGVLFVEVDDSFGVLYLRQVLGERPDITVYDRDGTLFDDVVIDLPLPRGAGEPAWSYRMRVEQSFIDRELAGDARREIMFIGWPGYEVPPRYRLEPVGLLYRVSRRDDPPPDVAAVWRGYREEAVRSQAERVNDGFALGIAATYPLARGERALHLGRRQEADTHFADALRLGRHIAGTHNYVGTLYGRIGDYDQAIAAFRRALEIKPVDTGTWNNLALAYRRAGRNDEARRAWESSLALVPHQGQVRVALRELETE